MNLLASARRASRATLMHLLQPWRGVDEVIHRRLAHLVEPSAQQETLWIGCGAGRSLLWWAARYGAHLHGVDADPAAIARAEEAARRAGLQQQVVFQVAHPTDLPYQDRSFDLAILNLLYLELADVAAVGAAVREAVRVVRPLARVVTIAPTWLGTPTPGDLEAVAGVGLAAAWLIEWKQLLREAGLVELVADDVAPAGGWLTSSLADLLGRAWRLGRWDGVSAALSRPAGALRRLSRRRMLGLSLVQGVRWPHR